MSNGSKLSGLQRLWRERWGDMVVSLLIDTGATRPYLPPHFGRLLTNARVSNRRVTVADGSIKDAIECGVLKCFVLDTAGGEGNMGSPWSFQATTVKGFHEPLLGFEYLYAELGYELYLRQHPRRSEMVKYIQGKKVSYPIRFGTDGNSTSGWHIDIVLASTEEEAAEIGRQVRRDIANLRPERVRMALETALHLHGEQGKRAFEVIEHSGMVESAFSVGLDDDDDGNATMSDDEEANKEVPREPLLYSIEGVKAGLRAQKRALTKNDWHKLMGHIGDSFSDKGCLICKMTQGSTRRVYRLEDAPRDLRPGHTWTLDTLVWSITSRHGCTYANVVRDTVTGYVVVLYMKERSEIVAKLEALIVKMRKDPDFATDGSYELFSQFTCDMAAEFMETSSQMEELAARLGFHIWAKSPDRHELLRRSENAVKLVETTIKSLLLTNNMPVDHHQDASEDAVFLLNRLPLARNARKTADQDAVRPIEELSGGHFSRRKIDRQLHYFVPYGQVALVQQPSSKVRASMVGTSKVRWGYKQGQSRSGTPRWVCPMSNYTFYSKSFTAFNLATGFNVWTFLGLETPMLGKNVFPKLQLSELDQQLVIRFPGKIETASRVDPMIRSINDRQNGVKVSVVDTSGKVFTSGSDGVLKQTSYTAFDSPSESSQRGVLHKLAQQGVISPTWNTYDRVHAAHNRDVAALRSMPHSFVGREFYKTFIENGKTYVGQVMRYTANADPLPLWHVKYNDGDEEDFDEQDMKCYVIERPVVPTTPQRLNPYVPPSASQATGGSQETVAGEADVDVEETRNKLADSAKITPQVGAPDSRFNYVTTADNDTWAKVCDKADVRKDLRRVYYDWLVDCHKMGHKADKRSRYEVWFPNPFGHSKKKQKFQAGIKFPRPSGPQWAGRADGYLDRCARANPTHLQQELYEGAYAFARARHIASAKLAQALPSARMAKEKASFLQDFLAIVDEEITTMKKICEKAMAAKLSSEETKALMTEEVLKLKPPLNYREAILRPDAQLWVESIEKEHNTLDNMEVFIHDLTAADLLKLGIDIKVRKPVPMRHVLTVKFTPSGEYDKHKARCVLMGHPGNMRKGIHYHETFSATPCQDSTRILQALAAGRDLKRFAFDVSLAYCWANSEHKVVVRYPQGYERFNDKGEELYAICDRNLYGSPGASRSWNKTRNAFFLKKFNEKGWRCKQSTYDPCLFVMNSPTGHKSWMLAFSDDVDMVGESAADLKYIADCCHKEWKIKVCNPEHMLGVVRRKFKDNQNNTVIEMTMQAYVERMYEEYREHLPKRTPTLPLEPGTFLSKTTDVPSEEEKKEVLGLGYQRVVGELLWATRNVFPEIAYGVNLLCRVMSAPTRKAWNVAMRIVAYLYTRRECGIRFSSRADPIVRTFVDSSDKPDPGDQKCQYGFATTFFGGPVIWSTKKHAHVGMSAPHNEFMALTWAGRSTAWIKFLFEDMEIDEYVKDPIVIYVDNRAAKKWSKEEYISEGNKFVLRPYFYIKELEDSKIVESKWLSTDFNIADLFTKAVKSETHNKLVGPLTGYSEPCLV